MSLSSSVTADTQSLPVFQDCEACPTMVVIPAGRFIMGADDQRDTYGPAHDQAMPKPFAVAQTEITFAQYEACSAAGACRAVISDHGWGRGSQPVINVAWSDAVSYADWLSQRTGRLYRLPTEAEWEYAARAGTTSRYSWGDDVGVGRANCRNCGTPWSGTRAAPVAQFPANGFGLYDMLGNVSEWVADCWADRHLSAELSGLTTSDAETCVRRVTRGGDWYYVPILSTSAARQPNPASLWSYTIGFRVAAEVAEP